MLAVMAPKHLYALGSWLLAAVFGVLAVYWVWLFVVLAVCCFALGIAIDRGLIKVGPAQGRPPDMRVFAPETVTPEGLLARFKDQTELSAKLSIQPYLGQWMRVDAFVHNVSRREHGPGVFVSAALVRGGFPFLSLWFDETPAARASLLRKGDELHVAGRLAEASSIHVRLTEVELVDPQPSSPAISS